MHCVWVWGLAGGGGGGGGGQAISIHRQRLWLLFGPLPVYSRRGAGD